MHWVLKGEQEFARPGRQNGTGSGTRTSCTISRDRWLGGWEPRDEKWGPRVLSAGPQGAGQQQTLQEGGLGGAGDTWGVGMLWDGMSLFLYPQ